jgi:protein SCO1/2
MPLFWKEACSRIGRGALLAAVIVTIGCGAASRETYQVTGVVRAVEAAAGQVKIAHEDIPGFMPAMTMNFDVVPAKLLEGIEPGMQVRFTLEREATTLRITALTVLGHEPSAGVENGIGGIAERELAPPFELVDHGGRKLALSDLRGKAVLLDFIFTRCPGPCPILTSAHVTLQRQLPASVSSRTHFVSITVDPENDTPSALRTYAETRGANLGSWSFLTGEVEQVHDVLERYQVGWFRPDDGTLNHLVITFLIDPKGQIVKRYVGLEHPSEKLLADLEDTLG